jgi:hypothetical protein
MISLCAPTLTRMLEARKNRILDRIHGEFRAGKTDLLTVLAELACVRDQISEIQSALKQLEAQKENI